MEKSIEKMLRNVEVTDLQDVIPQVFEGIDWWDVECAIRELRLSFKSKDIAAVCGNMLRHLELPKENLQRVQSMLKLFEVALSKSLTWKCFFLKMPSAEPPSSTELLKKAIAKEYRKQALNIEINALSQNENLFFMVQETIIMKKKTSLSRPMFYAFRPGLPFLFFTPHTISENHIEVVAKAIGYQECRSYSLTGKNINNLISMLVKKSKESRGYKVPDYEPALVEEKDGVYYFNQSAERKRYADELFKGDTKLTEFNVEALSEWRDEGILPDMEGEEAFTKLTFSGTHNFTVEEIFKKLLQDNHVTMPLPSFIARFPVLAKSQVYLNTS